MANRKANSGSFKKGNQASRGSTTNGRPALEPEIIQAKMLNRNILTALINKYIFLTPDQISAARHSLETQSIDHMIINIIVRAVQHGDIARLNWLVEQLCGKIPIKIETPQSFHSMLVQKIEEIRQLNVAKPNH